MENVARHSEWIRRKSLERSQVPMPHVISRNRSFAGNRSGLHGSCDLLGGYVARLRDWIWQSRGKTR